jgi:hypothetical protein
VRNGLGLRPSLQAGNRRSLTFVRNEEQNPNSYSFVEVRVSLKLAARHGFEPGRQNWEEIGAQFLGRLGLAGGVAGDAQIEVGKLALDILGRAEAAAPVREGGA